jgi:hypothetical protein
MERTHLLEALLYRALYALSSTSFCAFSASRACLASRPASSCASRASATDLEGAGLGFAAGTVFPTAGFGLGFEGAVLYLMAGLAAFEAIMVGLAAVFAIEDGGAAFVVASEAEVDVAAGAALVAALVAVAVDGFALAAAAAPDVGDGFFGAAEFSRTVSFGGVVAALAAAVVAVNFGCAGADLTGAATLVGRVTLVVATAGFTPVDADRVADVLVVLESDAVAVVVVVVVEAYALAAQHLGRAPNCRGSAVLRTTGSRTLDARDAFIVVMSR